MSVATALDAIYRRALYATLDWLNERFAGRIAFPPPANDNGFEGRAA